MRSHWVFLPLLVVAFSVPGFGKDGKDTINTNAKHDSLAVSADLGWISVRSNPNGAEVYDGSRFLGVTPMDSVPAREGLHVLRLFYPSARSWNSMLEVDTVGVTTAQALSRMIVFGTPTDRGIFKNEIQMTSTDPKLFLASGGDGNSKEWIGYTAGATMVISGALSAYLKTNSDNYFNSYLDSRDPNMLSRVRRLDTWAGVTLFLSEVSFGILTYLLLSE